MIKLSDDRATTLNELKRHTNLTDKLVSVYTDKEFIGQVDDCGFKIISSEIGRGAVCIFIGEFQDAIGTIEIRIHNAFKVLFSILMLIPLIGFGISIATYGIEKSAWVIIPMVMSVFFIRFALIELTFHFISRTGFNKLAKITGIEELH